MSSSSRSSRSVSALAVLVLGVEQQREDVVAALRVAASGDDCVDAAVEVGKHGAHHPDRLVAAGVEQLGDLRLWARREADDPADRLAQAVLGRAAARTALDAEDAGHDHVERDRLHARRDRERPADWPAVDLALGDLGDHLDVGLHGLAVEGRQQQLALAHVARADRGQHRVRSDDRPQRRLAGQRRCQLGLGGEQRLDVIGMAGDRQRLAVVHAAHAKDLAQLAARGEHELDLADGEAQRLQRARQRDRGWQRQPDLVVLQRPRRRRRRAARFFRFNHLLHSPRHANPHHRHSPPSQ